MNKLNILFNIIVISFTMNAWGIVGGELAESNSIITRSTVSLNRNGRSFCTGTLITQQHVLTAAHCINPNTKFQIGFGTNKDNFINKQIETVTVHPNFNREEFKNSPSQPPHDIAVIKIRSNAPEGFAPASITNTFVKKNDPLILAGFGLEGFFSRSSGKLKFVETIVQEKIDFSLEFLFGPTPGQSACRGDSGGPAYLIHNNQLMLAGVTSRGVSGKVNEQGQNIGCSGEGFYTDVLEHIDWISANL